MTHFAKQLVSIAILGLLIIVPLTIGEATDAKDRKAAKTAISGEQISKIEGAITAFRSQRSIPSVSVAIAKDNQIIFKGGYGLADLENKVPATPATVFRIASVSKSLTAVAVMQLAEKESLTSMRRFKNTLRVFRPRLFQFPRVNCSHI